MQDKDSESYAYYYLAIIALKKGNRQRAINYINTAIQLDNNIYKLVYKHEIFVSIRKDIEASGTTMRRYKYTHQEVKTRKYLDDTFILVDKMKYNTHSEVNNNESKKIEKEEKNREDF